MLMTVPFDSDKNIGREYNRIMKDTSEEYVGFQDHDTMFLTSNWKQQFEDAIKNADNPGIISCMTNRIGCPLQRASEVDKYNHDIVYQREIADKRFKKYGSELVDITGSRFNPSALVFATSKSVWSDVGGFKDGFIGVDTTYAGKVKEKGYRIYLMPGLYVYHWYRYQPADVTENNELQSKINTAVNSKKYFISVSYDTEERDNIDGLGNEDSRSNNLQHYWVRKDYDKFDVISSIDHVKEDFTNQEIIGEKGKSWA